MTVPGAKPPGSAGRLLVVEDDPEIGNALTAYGRHRGFEVFYAPDGPTGVTLGERERPDVILLDIALPGLDGRDVFMALKKAGVTEHSVVIFTTARDGQLDRVAGLEMGAAEYETKPYQLATLFTKIEALLEKKRAGRI
jgi:DNA-binding response OmpR family regulator